MKNYIIIFMIYINILFKNFIFYMRAIFCIKNILKLTYILVLIYCFNFLILDNLECATLTTQKEQQIMEQFKELFRVYTNLVQNMSRIEIEFYIKYPNPTDTDIHIFFNRPKGSITPSMIDIIKTKCKIYHLLCDKNMALDLLKKLIDNNIPRSEKAQLVKQFNVIINELTPLLKQLDSHSSYKGLLNRIFTK